MEQNNNIIRPMLNISTELVNEYINFYKLLPVYDETNSDTKYVRNKVRHKILPAMYQCGNDFEKSIIRLQKESFKLNRYFDLKTKHVILHTGSMVVMDREKFLILEDIEKEFLLGKVFSIFFRVTKSIIYETLIFFTGNHSKRLDLPNGYMVEQSLNSIRVFPSSMVADFIYYKENGESIVKTDEFTIEFSGSLQDDKLVVRNRRKGDRLKNKKLKDVFIDKHIELFMRDRLLVVEKHGEIIWVESIISNKDIEIKRYGTDNG